MKNFTIGISCIGTGIGQSVINSLNHSRLPIRTIGLGTNPFAYGAYDCDTYDYTKTIYDSGYMDDLLEKCKKYSIDLIIPGHDDEVLIYAQNAERLKSEKVKAIFASKELITLCRDKEQLSRQLNLVADVFVKSYDLNSLAHDIARGKAAFPLIAKPRCGFASKGIKIIKEESDLKNIKNDYVVQELAVPSSEDPNRALYLKQIAQNKNPQVSEISIQLVYSLDGELMGRMATYNKLKNGIPLEILPYDNPYVWSVIDTLTPHFLKMGLAGPLNIQGRMTDHGLKLFEMNPRFTGISGLRALMGFNEVEACVKEWLGIDRGKNKLFFNYALFGMRQTADKVVPIARNKKVQNLSKKLNQTAYKRKERIFITGATGCLGQFLVNKLVEDNEYELWLYSRDKSRLKSLFGANVKSLFDTDDYDMGRIPFGNIDTLVHLGFARVHMPNEEIAKSLNFTTDLFSRAAGYNVPTIVNISSQSVYGNEFDPPWNEDTQVCPASLYGLAKYATEVHLNSLFKQNKGLKYTSIRLGTLAGAYKNDSRRDFLSKMVAIAQNGENITVFGGTQKIDRLDIRDAVSGIICLIRQKYKINNTIYNLSSGKQFELKEIAELILEVAKEKNPGNSSRIIYHQNKNKYPSFGMSIRKFTESFDWTPKVSLKETISSLLNSE